jgi:hypothetical protein
MIEMGRRDKNGEIFFNFTEGMEKKDRVRPAGNPDDDLVVGREKPRFLDRFK